jgi:hypothetical protein
MNANNRNSFCGLLLRSPNMFGTQWGRGDSRDVAKKRMPINALCRPHFGLSSRDNGNSEASHKETFHSEAYASFQSFGYLSLSLLSLLLSLVKRCLLGTVKDLRHNVFWRVYGVVPTVPTKSHATKETSQ